MVRGSACATVSRGQEEEEALPDEECLVTLDRTGQRREAVVIRCRPCLSQTGSLCSGRSSRGGLAGPGTREGHAAVAAVQAPARKPRDFVCTGPRTSGSRPCPRGGPRRREEQRVSVTTPRPFQKLLLLLATPTVCTKGGARRLGRPPEMGQWWAGRRDSWGGRRGVRLRGAGRLLGVGEFWRLQGTGAGLWVRSGGCGRRKRLRDETGRFLHRVQEPLGPYPGPQNEPLPKLRVP